MSAYVYLIEEIPLTGEAPGPWTKIGFSQNPPEWPMHASWKRGNPRQLRVAAAFILETNEAARAMERAAHEHFEVFRHQREWFRIPWNDAASWLQGQGGKLRQAVGEISPAG